MIAETGLAALWIAASLSLLQLFFGIAALSGGRDSVLPAGEARGEGDRLQGGGGAVAQASETPLPHASHGPPPHGDATGRTSYALARAVRPVAVAQAVLVAIAFLALIQLFLRTDLSV